jgi:hypothetical protein
LAATGFAVEHVVPEDATANGPLTPMAVNVRLALPVFVTVMDCAALVVWEICAAKVSEEDDRPTAGAVPVPDKPIVCGLPVALSVNIRLPERLPVAVGVNVTFITQVPSAATGALVLHVVPVVATAKSPVAAMAVKVKAAVPVLVMVSGWAVLVVLRD